ncbi:MAG: hypothetical protein IRY99_14890, partial [Isosphaeraceae bacterium]|nr:hypothetical protein [Isosphaeraceae bacterium]
MDAGPQDLQEIPSLRLFPWLRLFRGIGLALDLKKLILAGLGMVLLWAGWAGLNRLFPASAAITPEIGWGLADASTYVQNWPEAAAWVAEPWRVPVAPFRTLFGLGVGMGAFFHAALAALWAILVWGVLGGAIARIAAVQLAKGERLGLAAALRFAIAHSGALIGAPLSPMLGIGFFAALCALFGLLYQDPGAIGPSIAGVLAVLPLLAGLVMTLILIGLAAGWPLMIATVAVEGEDGFDALSRSYSYVYQRPLGYAAYVALAWGLGVLGLIVVAFLARSIIHLTAWALAFGAPDDVISGLFHPAPTEAAGAPAARPAGRRGRAARRAPAGV